MAFAILLFGENVNSSKFLLFPETPSTQAAETHPTGWTVTAGDPKTKNWRFYTEQGDAAVSGRWQCTVGKFQIESVVWEFCHIIDGECRITPEGQQPYTVRKGDAFVLEKGFKGEWEVIKEMTKHYVIRF